ncbi:MAG: substrate-binding domain-containing protein [Bdellovibrionota bacterium]
MKNTCTARWLKFLCLSTFLFSGISRAAPKYKIAVIPKSDIAWWLKMKAGAQKAARELNAQVFWAGTATEDEVSKQAEIVESFIGSADAIVLAPIEERGLLPSIEAAIARGKHVVVVDSPVKSSQVTSTLATDNLNAGALGAREMAKALSGIKKPKVAVFRFMKNIPTTEGRSQGFIKEAEHLGKFEVVTTKIYAGPTSVTALLAAQELIKKNPDLDGIFAVNWNAFQNLYLSMKKIGKAGKIKLVGVDEPEMCLEALRTGEVSAVIMQNPFNMGYLGVKAAVDAINGKKVQKKFDTGTIIVTKENLDSTEIQSFLNPKVD